jgi:hypothetical protein
MSSFPLSWQKPSPQASLDSDDVRKLGDLSQGLDGNVGDGARRHVIDDDRQVAGFGDRAEMGGQPGLARLVVIRNDHQRRVGADCLRQLHPLDRGRGRIGAATRNYRHLTACGLDGDLDDPAVLGRGQGRDFAGCSAGYETMAAFGDLPFDEGLQ